MTDDHSDDDDTFSIKTLSTISSVSSKLYWRRRQNCCTNFYVILFNRIQHHARRHRRTTQSRNSSTDVAPKSRLTRSVGNDFVYSNAYEEVLLTTTQNEEKNSEIYFPRSESLHISPPPLPQRNFSQSSDSITPQPRPDIGMSRLNSPDAESRPNTSVSRTPTSPIPTPPTPPQSPPLDQGSLL